MEGEIRYYIKYFDVTGIEHIFNIYDITYEGIKQQIDGKVLLSYSETDDPLEAIRGQGLSVELEADETLSFSDLWSEEEKTFQCEYKRDNVILFQGWLNPEGFFENWVNTNWVVTFDCVDGLGYLQDLAFVEDATGLPITGRKTYLELLSLALIRTGLNLNINTNVDIYYTGLSNSLDILDNVYANTERYIKDDGETIMSCEEVIRDILEPFGAVLTSLDGEWYIYKPNQLYTNSEATFFNYTYLGVPSITPTKVIETSIFIGSDWKGATLHHCSGNQQIRNKASLGAYRINYKYGLANDLLFNKFLYSEDGVTLPGWVISTPSYITLPDAGESGVTVDLDVNGTDIVVAYTETLDILQQNELSITNTYTPNNIDAIGAYVYQVRVFDGVSTFYYLDASLGWVLNDPTRKMFGYIPIDNNQIALTVQTPPLPISGTIRVGVYVPVSATGNGEVFISEVSVVNKTETPTDLKGEFHTVQREDKPSSKADDVKEVATGDSILNIYEGTLYKTDQSTPTETWNRKGITESKAILQIMGEETLRMSQLPSRVFSGDVYGYFNYLSTVTIDGVDGVFEPIKYSYDTKANVISAEFRQMYANELTDIKYDKTFDYGNTVKPTIIG